MIFSGNIPRGKELTKHGLKLALKFAENVREVITKN